jgi:tRNA A58 N-methylase Trm61
MIAQGWGGAAGMEGNTEWQAVTVDAKNAWNMHAKVSKNVNPGATMDATMDATINANMSIL